jgi:hypothetical protein
MPTDVQSNPLGINVAQGDVIAESKVIEVLASDPAGNANTITGMTTANPTVITTTTAHGFISGKQVNINASTAFSATGTVPNGNYVATVLSSTTFSIPFNYAGTYTSGGAVYQLFQQGQVVAYQTWNGTASGAASAPAYPTSALEPITADFAMIGVILGPNSPGNGIAGQGIPLGATMQVVTSGRTSVYADTTTVALSQVAVASGVRPGCAKSTATAVTGKNLGVWLQAVTVSTAYLPQLAQCYIRPS